MDIAAPADASVDVWQGASDGYLNTTIESDGRLAFDAPQGFRVRVNIIEIGSECCIERNPRGRAVLGRLCRVRGGSAAVEGRDGG